MTSRARRPVALLVLASGAAITAGAMLDWVAARSSRPVASLRDTAVAGLFSWSYEQDSPFSRSFALAVLACGLIVFVGGLIASPVMTWVFSLLALAAGGLWIGLNATHYDPVQLPYSDLRSGAWLTAAGALAGLVGAFFLRRESGSRMPMVDWRA